MGRATTHGVAAVLLWISITGAATAQPPVSVDPDSSIPAHPTFAAHVAPILFTSCVRCHRPGEAAPFSLLTYEDARKRASMIERVTRRRIMPPWRPVRGHGKFAGESWLADAEIETIRRWTAAGAPEGDPSQLPEPPRFAAGWQLGTPDLVVTMPEAYEVPSEGPDIYRNFVIPVALPEGKWVAAIEVRPSSDRVLHHAILGYDTSGKARLLDGRDGQPGFFGMGGADANNSGLTIATGEIGSWAVGNSPRRLPLGLAYYLPPRADLVLWSHFHPTGKLATEQTTIGLHFTDTPPERRMVSIQLPPVFGFILGIDIPPGEANYVMTDAFVLPVDAEAVTIEGHAHMTCRSLQMFAIKPSADRESIFWIDAWNFNWQDTYHYSPPLALPKGTKLEAVLTYDNSADNPANPNKPPQRLKWGLQSTDEMGSIRLQVVARRNEDSETLRRAAMDHIVAHFRECRVRGGPDYVAHLIERLRMLDLDRNGTIELEEIPSYYRHWAQRLDLNRDEVIDQRELALLKQINLFLRGGDSKTKDPGR